jgi:shikimate dehydrogenase
MYNAAITALGLNYAYVPFAVADLAQAVAGVRHLGIAAVGVTIPYKIDIMPYLDELDSDAQRIGAVNVVVNQGGWLVGRNTDGHGAVRALEEQTPVRGQCVTLCGAGGAARAIAFALRDAGAELVILNRTAARAAELAQVVGGSTSSGDFRQLPAALARSTLVVQTTPVGMANTPDAERSPIPADLLRPDMTVMDIVSNPRETVLLQQARARGCRVVYGYRMLLWQGIYKFQHYTGVEPPIAVMEQAMEAVK